MWRGLWCRSDGQAREAQARNSDSDSGAKDQDFEAEDGRVAGDRSGEIEAFLARVYANQQC